MEEGQKKIFSNLVWRFAERCGAQLVSFVVSIILARILLPDDYGTITLLNVFITILNIFVDSGLGNALIQKKNADKIDFSTVFFTNIVFCIVLYSVLFAFAPIISRFYQKDELVVLIRVLGITILLSGVKNVQQAYVSRNMLFRKFFFATLGGTICAAVLGIAFAISGFGAWALVIQQITNVLVGTVILWVTVKWRPSRVFSFERLRGLFSFGWKLLFASLIDTIYNNLRTLIIGRLYSSADLAYYDRGKQFPNFIVSNINTSIDSILLPTMSSVQDDRERVKNMTRRSIKTSVYLMAPLMMGLFATAPIVVELLLTDKWLECVPFLRVFCITYMFQPIHTANLNAIKALGRSDLFLKLEIVKKGVGLLILFITMKHGVMVMAYSLLLTNVLSQLINSWPNKKLLNYSYVEQLKDITPSILLAFVMCAIVIGIEFLNLPTVVTLVLQVIIGAAIYIVGSIVLNIDSYNYILNVVKSFIKCKGE